MMGWGTTLLLVGRIAFGRNAPQLMKALICGLTVWLVAVLALFSVPLLKAVAHIKKRSGQARNAATEPNVMH